MDGDWQEHFSKTHQQPYWFNAKTGVRSWERPKEVSSSVLAKDDRKTDDGKGIADGNVAKKQRREGEYNTKAPEPLTTKVAIIVPYRDLHQEQGRRKQLDKFIPDMTKFLQQQTAASFKIYIIEQSLDDRKFNRGKLLNIGFEKACSDGCNVFIFHDVDLLPSIELLEFYCQIPTEQPIHIARVWDRYSVNDKYFGGITSFSESLFRQLNGFPNNFWGWGGEDDELYKRTVEVGMTPAFPSVGRIIDMEAMTLTAKLSFLRDHQTWKCMNKSEVLAEHGDTWSINGLHNLKYAEISSRALSEHCIKIKVDVLLNDHWTDMVCRLDDKQYDLTIDEIKAKYLSSKSVG